MADPLYGRHSLIPDSNFFRTLTTEAESLSSNLRWKRHASLDAGVSRARMNSIIYCDGVSYYDATEEEKRFLEDFPSARSSLYPRGSINPAFFFHPARPKSRGLAIVLGVALGVVLLVGAWTAAARQPVIERRLWAAKDMLEEYGVALPFSRAVCDNPYREYGHLTVDQSTPEGNQWQPYDPTCVSPQLFSALRSTAPDKPPKLVLPVPIKSKAPFGELPLPWLYGKTVLLFGDHVERFHSIDFCLLAGGAFETIGEGHPLSPPRFVNGIDEKLAANGGAENKTASDASRPTVCYVEQYDFMIVTVFHFGLANRVEFEHEHLLQDAHFYPPVAVQDRLTHIVLPLLHTLNRTSPDLIEFSTGFWDLRHFTAVDTLLSADPLSELTTERLHWYSTRLTRSLVSIGATFPTVPLLWRSLHQPSKDDATPFSRVAALDQLGRKVVSNLNLARSRREAEVPSLVVQSKRPAAGRSRPAMERASTHAPFLDRVKGRIEPGSGGKEVVGGRGGKSKAGNGVGEVRIDEWGALMLGQEHLMNGEHTPALPGGYLWGDIMLFELRHATLAESW